MSDVAMVDEADVDVQVREASHDEGLQILDRAARRWLGVSGAEFLSKWKRGDYVDDQENPDLAKVVLLIPFAE